MPNRVRKPTEKGKEYEEECSKRLKTATSVQTGVPFAGVRFAEAQSLEIPGSPDLISKEQDAGGSSDVSTMTEKPGNDEVPKLRETLTKVGEIAPELVNGLGEVNDMLYEITADLITETSRVTKRNAAREEVLIDDRQECCEHNAELERQIGELERQIADQERERSCLGAEKTRFEKGYSRVQAENSRLEEDVLRLQDEVAFLRNQTKPTQQRTALGKKPMQFSQPRKEASSPRGGALRASNGEGSSSSRTLPTKQSQVPMEVRYATPTQKKIGNVPIMVPIIKVLSLFPEVWPINEDGELHPAPPGDISKLAEICMPLKPHKEGVVEVTKPCEMYKKGKGKGANIFRFKNRKGMRKAEVKSRRCSACGCERGDHEQVSQKLVLKTHLAAGLKPGDCARLRERIDEVESYEPESYDEGSGEESGGESSDKSEDY